jgi:carbon-monoxide dehydrogenase medium subunit
MYSPAFDYHRANTLADAHRLLSAHPGAKLLAGGHSLIPMLKLRLSTVPVLVDIGRVAELRGISRTADGFRIGALTTHAEIASSAELGTHLPALTDAASVVGDPAVRNRGTLGGNIAHADPASDLPTVLVALGATVIATSGSGERAIAVDQFFTGVMSTALRDGEIIVAVAIPATDHNRASAYEKFAHPASRYAVVGAAAAIARAGGKCTAAHVTVGGLVSHARRLPAVERALVGTGLDDKSIADAVRHAPTDIGDEVSGDIFASADYRLAMAPVYVKRAIARAAARAGAA